MPDLMPVLMPASYHNKVSKKQENNNENYVLKDPCCIVRCGSGHFCIGSQRSFHHWSCRRVIPSI